MINKSSLAFSFILMSILCGCSESGTSKENALEAKKFGYVLGSIENKKNELKSNAGIGPIPEPTGGWKSAIDAALKTNADPEQCEDAMTSFAEGQKEAKSGEENVVYAEFDNPKVTYKHIGTDMLSQAALTWTGAHAVRVFAPPKTQAELEALVKARNDSASHGFSGMTPERENALARKSSDAMTRENSLSANGLLYLLEGDDKCFSAIGIKLVKSSN